MLAGALHTLLPHGAFRVDGAELAREDGVEVLDVVLGPLDARRHHGRLEARLVREDGVADDGEVDEGDLEDVLVQVAVEDALPIGRASEQMRSSLELDGQ